MDNGSSNSGNVESQAQASSEMNGLAEGIYNYEESRNQKDIDALKNRQKNEPINPNGSASKKNESKGKNSDIG